MRPLDRLFSLTDGREQKLALLIALLAVLACWALILNSGNIVKSEDEIAFLGLAQSLALEGRFANPDGILTAYRAPGLVFFLTPFAFLGLDMIGLRMVNAVLVGMGLLLVFSLVRRHAGPRGGLLAVVMVPLWPVVIYGGVTLYPQTLAAFLLVLTVWLLDRLNLDGSVKTSVLAGLACGFLILTVPVILLLFPFFFFWILLRSGQRRILHTGLFCLVSGLLVTSWTARNYLAFDAFVPVATSSGYNLMSGNAPNARYNTSLDVRWPEYVYTGLVGMNEVEANDYLTEAALQEMARDPQRTAILYVGKFLHWFQYSNKLLSDEVLEEGASSVDVDTREIILLVTYCAVIALPLVARLLMLRHYPFRPVEILILCLWIGGGLAYAIFFTRVRFRLPFDWLLISSNAMFLAALVGERLPNRQKGRQGQIS